MNFTYIYGTLYGTSMSVETLFPRRAHFPLLVMGHIDPLPKLIPYKEGTIKSLIGEFYL